MGRIVESEGKRRRRMTRQNIILEQQLVVAIMPKRDHVKYVMLDDCNGLHMVYYPELEGYVSEQEVRRHLEFINHIWERALQRKRKGKTHTRLLLATLFLWGPVFVYQKYKYGKARRDAINSTFKYLDRINKDYSNKDIKFSWEVQKVLRRNSFVLDIEIPLSMSDY